MPIFAYQMGGAANQIFIYAFARACAKKYNTDIIFEVSSYKNDPLRQYNLNLWAGINIPTMFYRGLPMIEEKDLRYDPTFINRVYQGCCIRGYFQSWRYWDHMKEEIFADLVPRQPLTDHGKNILNQIKEAGNRSVFLTVRRSDYTQPDRLKFHGLLPMEYYEQALEIIASKIDNPLIVIFSDEPNWVKENFKIKYPMVIAGTYDQTTPQHLGREDQDLFLMSQCKNSILANSSYSSWGAYMGPDRRGGVVVAPKNWFAPGNPLDISDIYKPEWIKI